MRKLYTQQSGDTKTTAYMHDNGSVTFQKSQDVSKIIKSNIDAANDNGKGFAFGDNVCGRQIAEIPNTVIFQWLAEGFDFFDYSNPSRGAELKRRLRDNPHLLTVSGSI